MSRYLDLITSQGADHYWSLNEIAGGFHDSIGSVIVDNLNEVTSTLAVVGNGAMFNGSTSVARTSSIDTAINFDSNFGFSYSYIAMFTAYSSNKGVMSKRGSTTVNRSFSSFVFNMATGTGLSFDIGSNQVRWTTGYYPPVNEWVHVAYTYNPATNTALAYINGKLLATNAYSIAPASTAGDSHFVIGGLQSGTGGSTTNLMAGGINSMTFFTRKVLSPEEISAQYNTAFPITRIFDGTTWHDADTRVIS